MDIKEVIREYFEPLKNIFISAACHYADPPDINKREFYFFVQDAKIPDRNINSGIIDTYFKASNFEEIDMDQNDDNSLCRFEFMEMIVRMAKGKYMDFGNMTSLSEATRRLIKEHILPMERKLVPWARFREEEMHQNDVNDLLQVNLACIRRVYDMIAKVTGWKMRYNL